MIIDHIGLIVSHYENSKQFYLQALKPLGIILRVEVDGYAGFGRKNPADLIPPFWIHQGELLVNGCPNPRKNGEEPKWQRRSL